MEDFSVIIKAICKELYDNLKYNSTLFSSMKSKSYLKKLVKINKKTEYKYVDLIREELGLLYRNYIIFSEKKEYENNTKILKKIIELYSEMNEIYLSMYIDEDSAAIYPEIKNIEKYITELDETYGGQTEKYLKKLSKKKIGVQRKQIEQISKDSQKIISEKKREVKNILVEKLNGWNNRFKKEPKIRIIYNYRKAEYILAKRVGDNKIVKKRYKFKSNFTNIVALQEKAMKNLKKLNYGISLYDELGLVEHFAKYIDPFLLTIFVEEGYLDFAKLYLKQMNGKSQNTKYLLPFKITYVVNDDFKYGVMTPKRNKIMYIIAERHAVSVADMKKEKYAKKRKNVNLRIVS